MFCSLSGKPTTNPVISPKSKRIFDRDTLLGYLKSNNNTDPITEESLTEEELIIVDTDPIPLVKHTTATSIPSLLSSLQNEWDALALEVFQLRKQLVTAKEELSVALYHHDAAVRVAAKAIRERDEARKGLQELAGNISNGDAVMPDAEKLEESAPEEETFESRIVSAQKELLQKHKSEKVKSKFDLNADIEIKEPEIIWTNEIKDSDIIDFERNETINRTLITLSNYVVLLVQNDDGKQIHQFDQINEPIVTTGWIKNVAYVVSESRILFENDNSAELKEIQTAKPHPSLPLLIIQTLEELRVYDVDKQKFVYTIPISFKQLDIHVDGDLLAGTNGHVIEIYNLSKGEKVLTLDLVPQDSNISQLQFGPNGYWLLASYGQHIAVVDLRKGTIANTIEVDGDVPIADFTVDPTSTLISVASASSIILFKYSKKARSWTRTNECSVSSILKAKFTSGSKIFVANDKSILQVSLAQ
ncbi:Splicing factor associated with the spliceosome [Komagataella phaffii CBS 7435]|uniref:Pre-mRNA-processing factor 19 n=2 Tax=Komagataella phaffii TaxID=460519 RepID=C4R8V3_KOMPG|nr:Splicing factor associated with the spliceosome [Komagataella phaffii GS115]AOA64919.1 GQ67_05147T0 [Komagataella phaffii]CAH2450566.1 Splicing factor associated with the spliceosome [Komagataella phaffii CBS 7435]AOA69523.1 GQ68_05129T0 [Komagataella phaffii GS115]CAY72028.1 Splicing factor associated with the spliceosome [Komagataella phaffii GS115]CCA40370.1 Splicing factor associated with the spliceosome [Komagataella phaffii CBS 7435]